jgi:hypothetical protein
VSRANLWIAGALAGLVAVASAGCQKGTFVEVTLAASAQSLSITTLEVTASNDGKTAKVDIRQGGAFTLPPEQSFSLHLEDDRRGEVTVGVTAFDGEHHLVASASDHTTIVAGGVAHLRLDLAPNGPIDGADMAGGGDMTPEVTDMTPSNPALASFAVSTTTSTIDEHALLSVHVVARDKDGHTLLDYAGTPALSSDWGDLRVAAPPTFKSGEAEVSVALNRETNVTNGFAHVTVADGTATGTSGGITVKAPLWTTPGTPFFSSTSTAWDKSFDSSAGAWFHSDATQLTYLLYSGDIPGPSPTYSIGLVTNQDGSIYWSVPYNPAMPVFQGGAVAWEGGSTTIDSAVLDGGQIVMLYRARRNALDGRGIAVSSDGKTWTRAANNPILGKTTTVCGNPYSAVVAIEGPKSYRIVYTNDARDKYCTVTFTLSGAGAGLMWQGGAITQISGLPQQWNMQAFVKEGSVYKLYAIDTSSVPHYATSGDGVNWVLSPTDPMNYAPASMWWNATTSKYEGIIATSTTFARTNRP